MSWIHRDNDDKEIIKDLREIVEELREIEQDVRPKPTPHLTKGHVSIMAKNIKVGETSVATLKSLDQNGAPMVLDATYSVAYAASTPASVTFSPVNADGSVTITGVAADPGNSISAVVTRPDGVQVTFTPDVLTIGGPVLTSGSVVLT